MFYVILQQLDEFIGEKRIERHVAHRHVQRREAELALERTPARRLDIHHAMRQILVCVELVRQRHALELRPRANHKPRSGIVQA